MKCDFCNQDHYIDITNSLFVDRGPVYEEPPLEQQNPVQGETELSELLTVTSALRDLGRRQGVATEVVEAAVSVVEAQYRYSWLNTSKQIAETYLIETVDKINKGEKKTKYEIVTIDDFVSNFERAVGMDIPFLTEDTKKYVAFFIRITASYQVQKRMQAEMDRQSKDKPDFDPLFDFDAPGWYKRYDTLIPVYLRNRYYDKNGKLHVRGIEWQRVLDMRRKRDRWINQLTWFRNDFKRIELAITAAEKRIDEVVPVLNRALLDGPLPDRMFKDVEYYRPGKGRPKGTKNRYHASDDHRHVKILRDIRNKRRREAYEAMRDDKGLRYNRNKQYPEDRKAPKQNPNRPHGWKKGVKRKGVPVEEESDDTALGSDEEAMLFRQKYM